MRILLLSLLVPLMAACGGGGSDISSSKKLVDLSAAERLDLCEELSFSREVTCDGITITVSSQNCTDLGVPPATCTATVGDARACIQQQTSATDAQLCEETAFPACEKLFACGV